MIDWMNLLIALIGAAGGAGVTAYFNRRKAGAETRETSAKADALEAENYRADVTFYQKRVEETILQMQALDAQVKELKAAIETAKTEYEQRVGELHIKIDVLKTELDRANQALDKANETIAGLREEIVGLRKEIKDGNETINKLLTEKAEHKGD